MVNSGLARLMKAVTFPLTRRSSPEHTKENQKAAFTEAVSIKVEALYNKHEIKRRKSFIVEADCVIQEGAFVGSVAANDMGAKIGCILKPSQDMREIMTPPHEVQTWHKRANDPNLSRENSGVSVISREHSGLSASSTVSAANSNSSFRSISSSTSICSRNSKRSVASSTGSASGVRGFEHLERAIEALEKVHLEIEDLKQVVADAARFQESPQLQKAIAHITAKKQATLRERISRIELVGEDAHTFRKLKAKLQRSLDSIDINWSLEDNVRDRKSPSWRTARSKTSAALRGSVRCSETEQAASRKTDAASKDTFRRSISSTPRSAPAKLSSGARYLDGSMGSAASARRLLYSGVCSNWQPTDEGDASEKIDLRGAECFEGSSRLFAGTLPLGAEGHASQSPSASRVMIRVDQ